MQDGSFKDAAIKILRESKIPMHYKDIADQALRRGLVSTTGKTPADSMGSRIATDLKNNGKQSPFIKTSPGHFCINPEYVFPNTKEPIEYQNVDEALSVDISIPKEPLENQYTGKAGEYLVASKLLFLGYNASIPAVDAGADLVAIKNEKPFYIQVKTAHLKKNRYSFNIAKASMKRNSHGGMFYVFVLRDGAAPRDTKESFLVFPFNTIEEYISHGYIKPHKNRKVLTTTVIQSGGSLSMGAKENNVNYNKNNWNLIK